MAILDSLLLSIIRLGKNLIYTSFMENEQFLKNY